MCIKLFFLGILTYLKPSPNNSGALLLCSPLLTERDSALGSVVLTEKDDGCGGAADSQIRFHLCSLQI